MSKQAMPIDTQQVMERLTGAGVPDQQARAHASVLREALQDYDSQSSDRFVTKQDLVEALAPIHDALLRLDAKIDATAARLDAKIDATAARLDTKIDAVDAKIDTAVSNLKSDLILWIASAGIFQTGVIAALVLEVAT